MSKASWIVVAIFTGYLFPVNWGLGLVLVISLVYLVWSVREVRESEQVFLTRVTPSLYHHNAKVQPVIRNLAGLSVSLTRFDGS